VESPISWVGGKKNLRHQIIPLIPEDHTCYVEVFAGGAWVLFGKKRSEIEVLNDLDGELINFYLIAKRHPAEFARQTKQIVISRRFFGIMKRQTIDPLTDIERAVRFYYLLKTSFGARMGVFGLSTDRKNKWRPATFRRNFQEVARRLDGVCIEALHYTDLIERYDRPWTLFYCDPPYVGCERMYSVAIQKTDHECLAGMLKSIKGRFILSYNDHPEIWRLYEGFIFRQVKTRYALARRKDGSPTFGEVIITNF
jgi:DNA adenine methylase